MLVFVINFVDFFIKTMVISIQLVVLIACISCSYLLPPALANAQQAAAIRALHSEMRRVRAEQATPVQRHLVGDLSNLANGRHVDTSAELELFENSEEDEYHRRIYRDRNGNFVVGDSHGEDEDRFHDDYHIDEGVVIL